MCIEVLDQNCIRNLFISIGYPTGPPSKIYEDKQATIKIVLVERITPQSRPLDVLITCLRELYLRKIFEMVDTISNMQLAVLKSKPRGRKSLRYITDHTFGVRFYPPLGSEHCKLLRLDQFHGPSHINNNQKNNN